MRILLVHDKNDEYRDKITFSLESQFGAEVDEVRTLEQAKLLVSEKADAFDLLICDYQKGSVAHFEEFQRSTSGVPTLLCFDKRPEKAPPMEWNIIAIIERDNMIKEMIGALKRQIEQGNLEVKLQRGDFCRIRAKILLSVVPLKGDIYIRLNEKKFVKLFHQGDNFEMGDLQKYTVKRGVEFFFIRVQDTQEFVEKYNDDLQRYLKKSYNLSLEEAVKVNESIYETVQELGNTMGFTKDVQSLCKTQVRMTVRTLGTNPSLKAILDKLETFKGQYLAMHSSLTGYLACAIASQLEWGSEATFSKLMLASFLHDVTLDNQDLARCESLAQAEERGFKGSDLDKYRDHPFKGGEIAQRFQEVPPDVDVIIMQHHEKPDGTGFPRNLTHAYISPLAATFSVAHELADAAIDAGKSFDIEEFLKKVRPRYNNIRYRKILNAVEAIYGLKRTLPEIGE
ncbi:MAG: hypothetical protein JNL01_01240 [Bdellovibrionales bacterium]|nr:hypothetical protein [Bdellovibrionales bacterium]